MKTIEIPTHVEITIDEYSKLLEAYDWLNCLEAAGVENWEGWDVALQLSKNPDR